MPLAKPEPVTIQKRDDWSDRKGQATSLKRALRKGTPSVKLSRKNADAMMAASRKVWSEKSDPANPDSYITV